MDFYNILIIPMVFGLIGFFEPCSLGINTVFLSVPLIFLAYFEKSNELILRISKKLKNISWLAGILLIAIGILTIVSGSSWSGAL